jgi:hypothetical protein
MSATERKGTLGRVSWLSPFARARARGAGILMKRPNVPLLEHKLR